MFCVILTLMNDMPSINSNVNPTPYETKTVTFRVRLSPTERTKLQAIADDYGLNMSETVRLWLNTNETPHSTLVFADKNVELISRKETKKEAEDSRLLQMEALGTKDIPLVVNDESTTKYRDGFLKMELPALLLTPTTKYTTLYWDGTRSISTIEKIDVPFRDAGDVSLETKEEDESDVPLGTEDLSLGTKDE